MKKLLLLLSILISINTQAQTSCESQRYISEVFGGYTLDSGIYFGSDDPYGILTNQDLYLDVYMPAGDTLEKRPVIVHQFGGGYLIGWRSEPNIPAFAEMYTKRGFVFVSVDYRILFNPLDAASAERAVYRGIVDLKASLRFLADNADTYGIDTSNIFLTGTSAGCISAMGQTFMDEGDRPASTFGTLLEPTDLGCINCTGNTNFNNEEVPIHGIINNWGAVIDTSVIDLIDDPKDHVPVISFHGTNDNAVMYVEGPPFSVPNFPNMQGAFLIHKRLETLGIKNELHPLVGYGHEPQLLNPDLTDTIVIYGSQFVYEIMQGNISPISGDTTVCLNDAIFYTVPLTTNSTYCWEAIGGTIINENTNSVIVKWDNIGTHILNLFELTDIEITKSRSINIYVEPSFTVDINYSSFDGLFNFNGIYIPNGIYNWSLGDGNNGSNQVISHQYPDTGHYEVILDIENDFCNVSDTIEIVSDICPNADFIYTINDSTIIVNNNSQFSTNSFWLFGDGTNGLFNANQHTYLNEGIYTIQLIVTNAYCNDTIEKTVEIIFCTIADFDISTNGLNISLTNHSFNHTNSFWNFGDGNTNGTFEPNHSFANAGTYNIELIVYNAALCSDTLLKTITIEENDTNTNIKNDFTEQYISVYPNPTNGDFYILNNSFKNLNYSLVTILGKNILSGTTSLNEFVLDIHDFDDGIYFLRIEIDSQVYIKRILKQ